MSWNWSVFIKPLLFVFLGFLIGIVSAVFYLAVVVDLSKLDGLSITTGVLVAITAWYAYTTHKILNDQRKSRQISYIRDRLEKLYYPLRNILNGTCDREIHSVVPFMYLGTEELNEAMDKYFAVEYDPDSLTEEEKESSYDNLFEQIIKEIKDYRKKLLNLYE